MSSKNTFNPIKTEGSSRTFNKIFNLRNHIAVAAMVVASSTVTTMNTAMAVNGGVVAIAQGQAKTQATTDNNGAAFALSDITVSGTGGLAINAGLAVHKIDGVNEGGDTDDILTLSGGNVLAVAEAVAVGDADNALTFILTGAGTGMTFAATTQGTFSLGAGTTVSLITDGDLDFDGVVDGTVAGQGTLVVSGDQQDVDKDIGQTKHLALINVSGDTAAFAEEINATAITTTGASTVFTKIVGADTVTIGNAALLNTFNLGLTAENGTAKAEVTIDDAGGADNVVVLAGTVSYKANFSSGAAGGEGQVKITGATTITGNVGTSALLMQDLNVDQNATIDGNANAVLTHVANGKTLTLKGNNGSTLSTLDDATAAITFQGAAAQTTKIIDGDATNVGVVTAANALGVTFNLELGKTNGIDKLILDGVANPLAIMTQDANKVGEIDMDTDATLRLTKNITNGQTVFTTTTDMEDTDVPTGSKIFMPINLSDGQSLKLFATVSQDTAFTTALNLAVQDNTLIDYTAAITDTDDYTVTAKAKPDSEVATALGITANTAKSLKAAYGSAISDSLVDNAAEEAFKNIFTNQGGFTSTDIKQLADQVAPQVEVISGGTVAAQAVTNSVQGIISNRMASMRSGDAFATGMSAGSGMSAKSGFMQVFGSTATQDNRKVGSGIAAGFDADSSGVAIGFDGISDAGTTVGLSLSMANTDLDGKGAGKAKTDIDTYTASIYMDKATDVGYIEGSLTFGMSENATSRSITSAGLNRTLSGSYDSEQISLNIGVGMPNEVGMGFVTPFASFTGTQIETDSYTEKSTVAADALRLKITQEDVSSMVGSIGVKYHAVTDKGTPMISLAINNEFGDTKLTSANTYTGATTVFNTSTELEEVSATLGLGYSFGNDYTSISLAYEADANNDDYTSHGGSIKIVGKF